MAHPGDFLGAIQDATSPGRLTTPLSIWQDSFTVVMSGISNSYVDKSYRHLLMFAKHGARQVDLRNGPNLVAESDWAPLVTHIPNTGNAKHGLLARYFQFSILRRCSGVEAFCFPTS